MGKGCTDVLPSCGPSHPDRVSPGDQVGGEALAAVEDVLCLTLEARQSHTHRITVTNTQSAQTFFFLFLFASLNIYLFLAVLGPCCCAWAYSGATFELQCVGFSLQWLLLLWSMGSRALEFHQSQRGAPQCRHNSCSAHPRGMWDIPRPRIKSMSPSSQGGFLTTGPPEKPCTDTFLHAYRVSLQLIL